MTLGSFTHLFGFDKSEDKIQSIVCQNCSQFGLHSNEGLVKNAIIATYTL